MTHIMCCCPTIKLVCIKFVSQLVPKSMNCFTKYGIMPFRVLCLLILPRLTPSPSLASIHLLLLLLLHISHPLPSLHFTLPLLLLPLVLTYLLHLLPFLHISPILFSITHPPPFIFNSLLIPSRIPHSSFLS